MINDVRYAIRTLLKRPAFAAVAIVTLALGIGVDVAIFSIVDGVLLRPLPLPSPDRLVVVWETHPVLRVPFMVASPPHVVQWRSERRVFDEVGGFASTKLTIGDNGIAEQVTGASVSEGLLPALGVAPAIGRLFDAHDYAANAPRVVLLGDALWRRRFAGDRGIVGRAIRLSGSDYTVVGIMPAHYNFVPSITIEGKPPLERSAFWIPQPLGDPNAQRGAHFLVAIARLRPDVTIDAAQRRLHELARQNSRDFADDRDWDVHLVPLLAQATGAIRPTLLTLLAAVTFVLLLACTNVANLLVARGVARRREMAIRTALGASRLRLARQLAIESLVLGIAGGAAGLLLAAWSVRFARAFGPATIARLDEAQIDGRVLVFTVAASLASSLLFGLVPLAQTIAPSIGWLKERGESAATGRARLRSVLVTIEVALALVLLVGGALLVESFLNLRSTNPGFTPQHAITFRVALPPERYPTRSERYRFARETLRRLNGDAGLAAAGVIDSVPIGEDRQGTGFTIEGASNLVDDAEGHTAISFPSAGYFEAIGLPLQRGRSFRDSDRADAPPVAIISQTLARQAFGDANPIGRRIHVGFSQQIAREIIGIVADDHHMGLAHAAMPNVYLPFEQVSYTGGQSFVVRSHVDAATTVAIVRRSLAAIEPAAAIYSVRTLEQIVAESMSAERFSTLLLAAFAAAAFVLAFIGVYGVTDELASQRTHELGVRMALGARPIEIVKLTLGGGLRPTAIGIAAGTVLAVAFSRFIRTLLFGVSAIDPRAYLGCAVLLAAAAVVASSLPARRAVRIDPSIALRAE
jgi:putative ABC transport system permease protein